jgi:ABC-2 type transport system ATP-binding protein
VILELDRLALGSEPGAPLPPVSAVAAPGRPGVVAVETEQTPVIASLVAGGRMVPDSGRLLVDGHEDAARVRRTVALVDTPGVAEPFPVMSVRRIVREELALAGRRGARHDVATVIETLGLDAYADTHVQRIPTEARVRLLVELALLRPGVEGLVVTSPERHGGHVEEWFAVLLDVARRGVTVLLVTSKASAETVGRMLPAQAEPSLQAEEPTR